MKNIVSILLMAFLSFAACLYFPWWSIAVVCFVVAIIIPQRVGYAFLNGFVSLFLLWFSMSSWFSFNNDHILAHRMSLLLFKMDNPLLLVMSTALIGAFVGGLAAMSGALARPMKK